MAEIWRLKAPPAAGSVTVWWLLRYIRRRQQALRARWHRLSSEEVEGELVAIAQRLFEVAPLLLPRLLGGLGWRRGDDDQYRADELRNSEANGHSAFGAVGTYAQIGGSAPDLCRMLGLIPVAGEGARMPSTEHPPQEAASRPEWDEVDRSARLAALRQEAQRLADELHRLVRQLGLADERNVAGQ